MPTYSIIIPTFNGLQVLTQCMTALFKHTRDFEAIVVDNGSTDGTRGYLEDIEKRHGYAVRTIFNEMNMGFARAINQGLEAAKGDFLVWLNNDVLVTPDWAEHLRYAMNNAQQVKNIDRVGLIGPCTNFAAGRQAVTDANGNPPRYHLGNLDTFATNAHKQNSHNWYDTGFLSGFCLMMKREVYEDVGPVEEWSEFMEEGKSNPGGYEDNDYVARAWLAGYRSLICGDTFVHHFGSVTLQKFPDMRGGVANGEFLVKKWQKEFNKEGQKLVAGIRVKWTQKDCPLQEVLDNVIRFADEIVIVDNGMLIEDKMVVAEHHGVVDIIETDGLDERRDRNLLIAMAREAGADWMISVDADEKFEDKFDRAYVERLMNPPFPMFAYCFHWNTMWDSVDRFRTDGVFGQISGARMFRMVPGVKIVLGNDKGFHCGNIPNHPSEFVRWTNIRIKHYGYVDLEERQRKFDWYEKNDTDKRPELIGGQDYGHLVHKDVSLSNWEDDCGVTLCMLGRNEEEFVLEALRQYWSFVDRVVFVDTGSTDKTKEYAKLMGADVFDYKWKDDFSAARNFASSKATSPWIWQMDPDEDIPLSKGCLPELRRMMQRDVHCILFSFQNVHPNGPVTFSENIRMFRRDPRLWFEGCAHETFDEALVNNKGLRVEKAGFSCVHKGYLRSNEFVAGKMKYYYDLNLEQVKRNPKDVRAMHSIATHLLNLGKIDEAMQWLLKADATKPYLLAKRHLAQLYARFAADQCREALGGCKFVRVEDHQYMENFMNAMGQFKFINIPVPHEGEKPVEG